MFERAHETSSKVAEEILCLQTLSDYFDCCVSKLIYQLLCSKWNNLDPQ